MDRIHDILNSVNETLKSKSENGDFTQVEEMEVESPEMELMEYKYDSCI